MEEEVRRKDDEISRLKKKITDRKTALAKGESIVGDQVGRADELL